MANEFAMDGQLTGQRPRAIVENSAGLWWNTSSHIFEAYASSHITNYATALTELGTTGKYRGNFPTLIVTAGKYKISFYNQQDSINFAVGDLNFARYMGAGQLIWDGTKEIDVDSGTMDLIATRTLTFDWTTITGEASRCALNALRFLRNRWYFPTNSTTLHVTKENDTTDAWTGAASVTDDGGITGIDPA